MASGASFDVCAAATALHIDAAMEGRARRAASVPGRQRCFRAPLRFRLRDGVATGAAHVVGPATKRRACRRGSPAASRRTDRFRSDPRLASLDLRPRVRPDGPGAAASGPESARFRVGRPISQSGEGSASEPSPGFRFCDLPSESAARLPSRGGSEALLAGRDSGAAPRAGPAS